MSVNIENSVWTQYHQHGDQMYNNIYPHTQLMPLYRSTCVSWPSQL